MIQTEDDELIQVLKEKLGAKTKIEVLRQALALLDEVIEKRYRIEQWKKVAKIVGSSGLAVGKEFKYKNRFDKLDK